jgi:hypothetical protein
MFGIHVPRMKIQFLGSHTITLPVIQASRNAMKDLATNTRDKPSQIFAQVVSQCDDNVQDLLPREENPNSIPASNSSNGYTAVPVTSLNGTRMVYSCLNGYRP